MEDTIAAIATAYGEGGIGIIRISGEKSLNILNKIFVTERKELNSHMLTYGRIMDPDSSEIIDEVMAVYMKAPHTYTKEDVVEINCHGSMVSLKKTLDLIIKSGARLAEPGEFTKRAFLNGRIDLSQAEAVMDLVSAKTDKTFELAISQLEGLLSSRIIYIREQLLDLLVNITVNIDYPDEDIEEIKYSEFERNVSLIGETIENLLSTANTGRMIREGIRVVIVGKPNVGKSSLMNGLLKESRAIVTEIPGTTRDTIEEALTVRGIPVYLTDTAGIRDTGDIIEKIGIEKTKEAFNRADYIIFIIDASKELTEEDFEIIRYIGERKAMVLLNKQDKGNKVSARDLSDKLPNCDMIECSLIKGEGLSLIEDKIEELVYGGMICQENSLVVTNLRHVNLLRQAAASLSDALVMIRKGEALDIIEIDVKNAYDYLGEIVGDTVTDDILTEVFSRFCLGK